MSNTIETLDKFYEVMKGNHMAADYDRRHHLHSLAILTVTDDERAALVAEHIADRVRGKTVVEIGGGIGLLAFHVAQYAERVFVIEANPCWTSVYVAFLHARKPPNVTWIFGMAEEMEGQIRADAAYFCTFSNARGMAAAGRLLAPKVIDVYGEVLESMDGDSLGWKLLPDVTKEDVMRIRQERVLA